MSVNGRLVHRVISVTPVITAEAYTTGQVLGAQTKINLAVAGLDYIPESGVIRNVTVICPDDVAPSIDIFIYSKAPTQQATKATLDVPDADAAKYIARLVLANTVFTDLGGATVGILQGQYIPFMKDPTSDGIYVQLVCRGSHTFTSTAGLQLKFGIQLD